MRYESYIARQKLSYYLVFSTCRATSFECFRHIQLGLQQSPTYPSMTSKPYSLSYFEHSSNWYFSMHSLWRYIIIQFPIEKSAGVDKSCENYIHFVGIAKQMKWNVCIYGMSRYRTNAAKNGAACRNTSQVVKWMHPLQHLLVFQSWYNVSRGGGGGTWT